MFKNIFIWAILTSLYFLACEKSKKSSDLTDQIKQLQEELNQVTDPERVLEIQTNLKKSKFDSLKKREELLHTILKETTDETNCEKVMSQLRQINQEIKRFAEDNFIVLNLKPFHESYGGCGDKGHFLYSK
ncbi:MAG: hypothetical protein OXN83_03830 [Oligoflexia bacterium]|nr:hypothetical protein [Oligoflexia bacterium]